MDGARAYLTDVGATLFTNTAALPYVKLANKSLEQVLMAFGLEIQRKNTAAIDVAALAVSVTLPSDFFVPTKLWERADGGADTDWIPMDEVNDLVGYVPVNTLNVWSFYNNVVNLGGCTVAREVLMEYERSLAAITSASSPIDDLKLERYLSAKTAELCARYIGRNSEVANELLSIEVNPAKDDLEHILVGNMQGVRHRRGAFTASRGKGVIVR